MASSVHRSPSTCSDAAAGQARGTGRRPAMDPSPSVLVAVSCVVSVSLMPRV
ncbi:hypothetical protein [Streptacidiphilus sp. PAMC 29251]